MQRTRVMGREIRQPTHSLVIAVANLLRRVSMLRGRYCRSHMSVRVCAFRRSQGCRMRPPMWSSETTSYQLTQSLIYKYSAIDCSSYTVNVVNLEDCNRGGQ